MKQYNHIDGYIEVVIDGRRTLLHRLIYERHHNIILTSDNLIHHIDGNKKNNNINNLQLMTFSEHSTLHGKDKKREKIELKCMCCGKKYKIDLSQYKTKQKQGQKVFVCSKRCVGLLNEKYLYRSPNSEIYKQNVINGLNKGLTGYEISKKYDMNRKTVYNIIKRLKEVP